MDEEPHHDLITRWVTALDGRDVDALVALADPEIDLHPLQISTRGHFKDHDGIRQWMQELTASDPGQRVRVDSVRKLADDRTVLLGAVYLGGEAISPYSLTMIARDGKVLIARAYLSDDETLDRLGLLDA